MTAVTEKELLSQIRLINTPNIGTISFYKLYKRFGSAAAALENLPTRFRAFPQEKAQKELQTARRKGIKIISFSDSLYPQALKEISDCPPLLYALGNEALLNHASSLAVVGSRNASVNGRKIASRLSYELTENNTLIVSGMARGIDSSAHKGAMYALNQQGPTIAVLGTGIDIPYPEENKELYKQIIHQGLVISEYPLGTLPQPQNFPRRNRIIAGLTKGTLVVEANLQSGSLITARLALEQNREVFAIPGSPIESRSTGTNRLIKDGAYLVENIEDILTHLELSSALPPRPKFSTQDSFLFENPLDKAQNNVNIPKDENTANDILSYLSKDGTYIDELIRATNLSADKLAALLIDLELSGEIERLPGNKIALTKK